MTKLFFPALITFCVMPYINQTAFSEYALLASLCFYTFLLSLVFTLTTSKVTPIAVSKTPKIDVCINLFFILAALSLYNIGYVVLPSMAAILAVINILKLLILTGNDETNP